ncbi:UNVERIFIED_ORG: hypothetical protein J2Y81_006786 [Paraburkholderia sediminicola]|nr:hypothetical protein [Paraburkholderia sediminicola]
MLKHLDLQWNTAVLRAIHAPHACLTINAPQGERE